MIIFEQKALKAKQHWEPQQVKGITQNVDFEQRVIWIKTTLGTIKSEGNYLKC